MFMFLYHFLWTILFVLLTPVFALSRIGFRVRSDISCHGVTLNAKMGWRFPNLRPRKGGIWVHALSVGEVISAIPLVDRIGREFPDRDIVFTATTATGLAAARKNLDGRVRLIFPMPLDGWWSVRRVVDFVKPSVFILVETDIWPGLLDCLKRKGARNILVNGRVSPRTFGVYKKACFVVKKMFDAIHLCLMQSDVDRDRLVRIGIDKKRVITSGNIKFDRRIDPMDEEERRGWLCSLGLDPEDALWVAGSTHPGEEEIVLDVFKKLRRSFPRLQLVVAPRDLGRSGDILRLAGKRGIWAVLKTRIGAQGAEHGTQRGKREAPRAKGEGHRQEGDTQRFTCDSPRHAPGAMSDGLSEKGDDRDVIILDTLGELGRIYGLGSICFVGGSLVPVGGHNLLEPAGFGIPVVFGPHTHNFVSMSAALLEAGGGCRVCDGDELYKTLKAFLEDGEMRSRTGEKARVFVEMNRGALERVLCHVKCFMGQGASDRKDRDGRSLPGTEDKGKSASPRATRCAPGASRYA